MRAFHVALVGLAVSAIPAAAQTPTTPTAPPAAPMTTTMGATTYYKMTGGEIRASKMIGTKVVNEANDKIGDVNEIILNKDGRVAAVVVGVGGFLGMGEHDVALDFKSLQLQADGSSTIIKVNATKDQLKAAPKWTWSGGTTGNSVAK